MKHILFYLFTGIFALTAGIATAVEIESTSATSGDAAAEVTTSDENTNEDGESSGNEGSEEEESSNGGSEPERAEIQQRIEDRKAELDQKREEVEAQMQERRDQLEQNVEETQATIEQRRVEAQERLEEKKAELEQKREEFRERMNERRQELILAYATRMADRLNIALDRLENVAERILSRVEKLDPEKFETTIALENTATVNEAIEPIRTRIDQALEDFEAAFNAEDPQTEFANIRTTIKGIGDEIRVLHQLLVDAVVSIRAQVTEETQEQTGDASSAEENTEEGGGENTDGEDTGSQDDSGEDASSSDDTVGDGDTTS